MAFNNFFSSKAKLAQAYKKKKKINQVYDLKSGLYFGTIFPELNMLCKFDFYAKNKFFREIKNNFMEED